MHSPNVSSCRILYPEIESNVKSGKLAPKSLHCGSLTEAGWVFLNHKKGSITDGNFVTSYLEKD